MEKAVFPVPNAKEPGVNPVLPVEAQGKSPKPRLKEPEMQVVRLVAEKVIHRASIAAVQARPYALNVTEPAPVPTRH